MDKLEIQDDMTYATKGPDTYFDALNVEVMIKSYLIASSFN